MYAPNFNPEKSKNPFSYFTTIAFHAFINRIKKEKKHRETLTNYQEAVYSDMMTDSDASCAPYISSDDAHMGNDS